MKKLLLFFLLITSFYLPGGAQPIEQDIKKSVITFIDSLTTLQQKRALLKFDDTARIKWNNLPVGLRARAGISIGSMNDAQRQLIHRILSASLSSQGYLKATSIMHLDNLINMYYDSLYQRKAFDDKVYQFLKDLKWSNQNFYFAIFGNPKTDDSWGYKLEGHHLSLNFTFHQKTLSVTPMFVGTDPAEMLLSEYAGWRVLGQEEDLGIKLLAALTPEQKKKAIMSSEVPEDIITAAESGKRLVDYWGIKGSALDKNQQGILQGIIREFVFNLEYEKAVSEYEKL